MDKTSIAELKHELRNRSKEDLIALCLRMARFKAENKQLLTYLVFEAENEAAFVEGVKTEINTLFCEVNTDSVYFAKKTIRKILRITQKYIRISGSKQTEVELLTGFCLQMRELDLPFIKSKVLINLYERQLQAIRKALATLDEDLQFDYRDVLREIAIPLA